MYFIYIKNSSYNPNFKTISPLIKFNFKNKKINTKQRKEILEKEILEKEILEKEILEKQKKEILEKQRKEILEKQREEILEKQRKEILEKQRKEILEKQRKEILEKQRKEILEKQRKEILEKQREEILEKQRKEILDNNINLIGIKNINVSISENLILIKNYLTKLDNKITINIYDISEINKVNYSIKTIFCIQPFENKKIIPYLSKFVCKPEALWIWEFKSLPRIFKDNEKFFSKIYVPSQFCYDVFSKHLSIPIEKIELQSIIHNYLDKIPTHIINNKNVNDIIKKTKNKTIYGYCFDLNSSIIRKNPLNLVKAFNKLNDKTKILILKYRLLRNYKFVNKMEKYLYNEFILELNKNNNIYTITDELEELDLYKLYTYFHYYISPHCGEGYGLTIYDNMILGNKIISPYYSGETDYLNRKEIIELEYEEIEIDGLKYHLNYGEMSNFKAAYISVESIEKCFNDSFIPRKIFQTWKTKELKYSLKLFQESWKRCNHDFEYVIFDDNDCDDYIYNNSKNKDYINIYNKIKESRSKADLADFIRYLYIYNEGGVYTDIDTICLQNFTKLYDKYPNKKIILGLESDLKDVEEAKKLNISHPKSLALHTFISAPKHPIFKQILDKIKNNNISDIDKKNKSHGKNGENNYGTHIFNKYIYNNLDNYGDEIEILSVKTFSNGLWVPHSGCDSLRNNEESYSCHLYFSSWINKHLIEFNREAQNINNFKCKVCNKLNGDMQEWEQAIHFGKLGFTATQSLINYAEKEDELDIYLLCKDNELYLKKYFPPIKKELEEHFKTTWIIYENGSTDDTKNLLHYYFHDNWGGDYFQNKYKYLDNYHNFKCNACSHCYKNRQELVNQNKLKDLNIQSHILSLNDGEINSNLFNKENCKYIEYLKYNLPSICDKNTESIGYRCEKLAIARENLMKLHMQHQGIGGFCPFPKWCLLIDSDVVFDYENTVKPLLDAAKQNPDGVMFTANGQCIHDSKDSFNNYGNSNENLKKNTKFDSKGERYIDNYYYDTFALEYGKYLWDWNILDTMNDLFNGKNVAKVKSAFAGVVLIKKEVLNLSSWSTVCEEAKKYRAYQIYGMSEHYHFCQDVRRFGEIYVVKNSVAYWMMDNGYQKNLENSVPKADERVKNAIIDKRLLKNYIEYKKL